MKKIYILILCVLVTGIISKAQNLVPNSSFESFSDCPDDVNYDKRKLIPNHWFSPTLGTADYFNSCSRFNVSVPINIMGSMFAADSNAYAGIILLEKPDYINFNSKKPFNYREYISCRLIKPLQKDTLYSVRLRFAIADFSTYITDRVAVAFTVKKPHKLSRQNINLTPAIYLKADIDTLVQSYWYTLEGNFKAKGNEKYLTIGNFFSDKDTKYVKPDYSLVPKTRMDRLIEDGFAYYYIDDISIIKQSGL